MFLTLSAQFSDLHIAWRGKEYVIESSANHSVLHLVAPICTLINYSFWIEDGCALLLFTLGCAITHHLFTIIANKRKTGKYLMCFTTLLTNSVASSLLITIGCKINVEALLPLAYPLKINNKIEHPGQYLATK